MLSHILSIIALGGASTGALISARAIGNTDNPEEKLKNIKKMYENAFNELANDLEYTHKLTENHTKVRHETLMNLDTLIRILDKISTTYKPNEKDNDTLIQQIQEKISVLNQEKYYLNNNSIENSYAITKLGRPIKIAVQNLPTQDLVIQKFENNTTAWLRKFSISMRAGGMILGALLASSYIIGSPAVLIGGILLTRQIEKAFIKVNEYEAEVNDTIEQINSAKQIIKEVQQQISDSIRYLQLRNELFSNLTRQLISNYNQLIANDKNAEIIKTATILVDSAASLLEMFDITVSGSADLIKKWTPIAEKLVLSVFNKDVSFNIFSITSITLEECERRFLMGIEEITNIGLERQTLNLDLTYPQIKAAQILIRYLLSLVARSHQVTMNS